MNHPVIELTKQLIARQSITPVDDGCQEIIANRLAAIGFNNETMVFEDTTNLWSRKGSNAPLFCFAGHTDVVPPGPINAWHTAPFTPVINDGILYGRGAADMKGSLAAMVVATEQFVADYPTHKGNIAFLITSDEEGPFINGTTRVIDTLEARNEKIDWCLVGEPSSSKYVGDIIKNGRRGSISGELIISGTQGHVAYPEMVENPIHLAAPVLHELASTHWDMGNEFFPPTSFQFSNIQSGTGATNVVPGHLTAWFNLRFSTELSFNLIIEKVEMILNKHKVNYEIKWTFNGKPFVTEPGKLVSATVNAITAVNGKPPVLSTSGGTSDGRFIAPTGAQVIELGPRNATIHQVNECVSCDELVSLSHMYYNVLKELLC